MSFDVMKIFQQFLGEIRPEFEHIAVEIDLGINFGKQRTNLTLMLAGGLYEDHRSQNRFCEKPYPWMGICFIFKPLIDSKIFEKNSLP